MEVANYKTSALPRRLRQRETKGEFVSSEFQRQCHLTPDLVERLGLEKELEGHTGCVNCIEWSYTGELLASGSDDKTVILWDGLCGKKRAQVNTVHEGNIFSVKFLPQSDNHVIATAAGDYRVCVQDVETSATTHNLTAHMGRVKRLAVAEDTPHVFWSAAEDGTVMQWDVREKYSKGEANVLVNLLNHTGRAAECKCIAICPSRPELMAVGANDPYVRVYDRRMLTLQRLGSGDAATNWERRHRLADAEGEGDATPRGAVAYFVPGHLPGMEAMYMKKLRPLAATYVTYSPDGTQLLVNLGGEQIYLYDRHALFETRLPLPTPAHTLAVIQNCDKETGKASPNGTTNGYSNVHTNGYSGRKLKPLPRRVETIKLEANAEFEAAQYTAAIQLYNQAIAACPHPILYGNRGAALMKRRWDGDVYAALRDCHTALALDPGHIKAHLRLARCLHDLDWPEEANQCLDLFKTRYPEHVKSQACRQLQEDIASTSKKEKSSPPRQKSDSLKTAVHFLKGASSDPDEDDSAMEDESVNYPAPRGRKWSSQEIGWRAGARDYSSRFCGHCNTTTDIKEANFFGGDGQYVVAGSDDGKFFIWDRETTNIVRVLRGDESIVNCLQGHPIAPILATSGIDPVVRLWQPLPQDGCNNERMVEDAATAATNNQRRMNADPFETILLNMGYRKNTENLIMSSLKFNHEDDEEKLMVKALYVGKVDDEDDDSDADLWNNAYKDGHDFIRRQIKERKKIPMISKADNIPTQKKPAPKSSGAFERSIVLAPPGCCPCPAWQKEQVKEFSKIRLKLSQHMSLLKSSNQGQVAKIPDKRNESLWCHLCFGSKMWKLIEESSEDEGDIEVVKGDGVNDVVDGQEPLLHIISSMPNHVVEAVLEYQVSWLRKVGWFPGLGPWLYALLARLEKPLTPDTSSLIRSLALKASQERARIAKEREMQIKDGDPDVAACSLFVCLISEYFSQGDLADRDEGEED